MKFKHLEETGYTYGQHFRISIRWATRMFVLSTAAFTHAVWPDVFSRTVSTKIKEYNEEINPRKD